MAPSCLALNRRVRRPIRALTKPEEAAHNDEYYVVSLQTVRKGVQVVSFVLFILGVFGLGPLPVVLPVMFTLGLQVQTMGDAFAMMQAMLYESIFPWIPLAAFFIVAGLLGRSLCGWVCPFGLIQDILTYFQRKRQLISSRTHEWMLNIKYLVLVLTLIVSGSLAALLATGTGSGYRTALGPFARAPFNALSPGDTLFAVIPTGLSILVDQGADVFLEAFLSVQPLLWLRFIILGFVLVFAVYVPRSWCKYFCPHGAILSFLNRFSFLGLQRDPLKCTKAECNECVDACPMKVPILYLPWEKFTHPECIYCMKCMDACPTKAIKPKFP